MKIDVFRNCVFKEMQSEENVFTQFKFWRQTNCRHVLKSNLHTFYNL